MIHADSNFKVLSITGQTCDVQRFHNSFQALSNTSAAVASTVYVYDTGRTFFVIDEAMSLKVHGLARKI